MSMAENLDRCGTPARYWNAFFMRPRSFPYLTTVYFGYLMNGMNPVPQPKYALAIAEGTPPLVQARFDDAPTQWQFFVANAKTLESLPKDTIKIHENVWLIPLATGIPFLAKLIESCPTYSVSIRVIFLEEIPKWIKYPPNASPKIEV
jgi:hypothetical protein